MCAPCKIIINEESANAAQTLHLIAEQLLDPWQVDLPQEIDDALYDIASEEVDMIESRRAAGVAMAKMVGASDRWVKLMERL